MLKLLTELFAPVSKSAKTNPTGTFIACLIFAVVGLAYAHKTEDDRKFGAQDEYIRSCQEELRAKEEEMEKLYYLLYTETDSLHTEVAKFRAAIHRSKKRK